jgi:hypothetical protein
VDEQFMPLAALIAAKQPTKTLEEMSRFVIPERRKMSFLEVFRG